MKLRMQANSVRLRLKRGEVEQLTRMGRVEERISFGGRDEVFQYVLETSRAISQPKAALSGRGLLVQVPVEAASDWARGNEVGIEAHQGGLQILIEKDFACLNGTDEQNADTFPNPLAGTKC